MSRIKAPTAAGAAPEPDSPERARANALDAARLFCQRAHQAEPFVAGSTYVAVTAKVVDAEDLVHLVDACLDLWLTSGRYVHELETLLAARLGRPTPALLVNSGSSANLIAVSSLGSATLRQFDRLPLEKGDEIITAAAGFPTTVNPIIQNGWVPVFVDVDFRVHGELTNSNDILHRTFWVGVHPGLDAARLTYMLEQLEAGVRAQRR
jgi:CDP-6-deoxy-D-xylo-4-hexulose-3-dehydrase